MSAKYRLRYFFDFGSDICLWAGNDAARDHFGYPVGFEKLPLPATIQRRGWFVAVWHNTFMDWDNAPEPSRWWPKEQLAFNAAAQELLPLLREHLGPDFEIVDESLTRG